ncbi:hypothetical protein LTR62_008342 [Meristemomyces frigidus]|uniref:Mediator of RNA polymerase II transcription subunit 19 n=1 Tax=Meristemomyces frigidus TaxID=1508187 RepID=A0AAN7YH69_9PEZI|nr:hypothetical protein LTR62_008342 [Meristemomyces frigidus]
MSPAWQPQHLAQQQNGGSVTFPTPPSTAGLHSQVQTGSRSEGGQNSGHSTPLLSSEMRTDGDADGDAEMAEGKFDEVEVGDVSMANAAMTEESRHRRTDHEREAATDTLPPLPPRIYKLHSQPIAPARPHLSTNLISLYNLANLQASVARRDAAGNKINKLRKSYEGKVKALGLEGRSKASVGDNALAGLVDPEWNTDVGDGTTYWDHHVDIWPLHHEGTQKDVLGKLVGEKALDLRVGQMGRAEHEKWKAILGLDEAGKLTPALPATKFPASAGMTNGLNGPYAVSNPALAKTAAIQGLRASAPNSPAAQLNGLRPDRSGKKRRYDESSYTGYHEGFDDDGYDTGDGGSRRGSASKRQKTTGLGAVSGGRKLSVSYA